MNDSALLVFENYKIRRHYDEENERWYFSVVDIIAALIQQPDYQAARNYWKVLKNRLNKEGSETVTKCNRLKMVAEDGRIAKGARRELESKTGKSVITGENYLPPMRKQKQITKK